VEIVREAEEAARRRRGRRNRLLLERVLEHAGALGRGANGVPDTQRALRSEAVDLLVLSPAFLRVSPEQAERFVRGALLQGADVEVLSGDAANYLDDRAEGIAARLRFAPHTPGRTLVNPVAFV
jgi:peptide subunit release factor 1 (eRF1)